MSFVRVKLTAHVSAAKCTRVLTRYSSWNGASWHADDLSSSGSALHLAPVQTTAHWAAAPTWSDLRVSYASGAPHVLHAHSETNV